uniref:RNA-directed RNA polymerase n=1 Tax=Globodera pallida TaxID=36090 RepID=A0A183BXI8_GLOPA
MIGKRQILLTADGEKTPNSREENKRTNAILSGSFFTTSRVIEQRLWDIRQAARKTFFGSFGGDMETLTDDEGICNNPSDQLKFLARAYYTIGYNSTSRKFLSFPWIASWEVLDAVRRSRILASLGQPGDSSGGCSRLFSGMFDSFGEHLTEHIEHFNSSRRTELGEFSSRCFGDALSPGRSLMIESETPPPVACGVNR